MGNRFEGKVAVVTDAASPVASAVAELLGREGASLVVNSVGPSSTRRSRASGNLPPPSPVGSTSESIATEYDVADMADAEALIAAAVDAYGRLDVLVNSAGLRIDAPVHRMEPNDFDRVVSANLKAVFAPTKFAAALFRQQRSGRIVNLTSDAGLGVAGASAFSASSEAVVGLTRTVARDLGKYGVTCNALCVGDRPEGAAALAALLCAGGLLHVNGCTFGASGGTLAVYADPVIERSIHKWGTMTLDEIAAHAPGLLETS